MIFVLTIDFLCWSSVSASYLEGDGYINVLLPTCFPVFHKGHYSDPTSPTRSIGTRILGVQNIDGDHDKDIDGNDQGNR